MKNLINIDVENGYPVSTEIFIHELSKQQYQQVSFYRGNTVIPLTGITVTATIVCNKCLVAEDIPISLSAGETNIVDFPLTSTNDYTILPGEMLVEFKLSKDGVLIYPAVAMVVMVTPSIRDDAQVTPQSYGTVSEILQEVANARGNFNSLGARLDNSDNRFSNYDTKEKTSSARGSYFFTDDGRIFAQSYDTVITENSFNVELSELPALYNVWIDKSVTNVMANSIENTAEHRVKAYYVEDSTMELPSSILSAHTNVYHGFRYKQHVNNILKSVSKNYSDVLTIDKAVKSAGISFLFDNNGRIFAQTVDTTIGANSFDLTIDLPAEYNAWFAKNVVNVATGALTNTSAHKLKHIYAENDDLSLVQFSEDWNVIHRGFYPTLLKHYIYNSIAENYGDITNINGDITNINGDITNINGDIEDINTIIQSKFPVNTADIKDGAINSNKLGTGSVNTEKLTTGAVTSSKIDGGAVTEDKLDNELADKINDAIDDITTLNSTKLDYVSLVSGSGQAAPVNLTQLNALVLNHYTFYFIWLATNVLYDNSPSERAIIFELEGGSQFVIRPNGEIYSRHQSNSDWGDFTKTDILNPSKVICFDTNGCISAVASLFPTYPYTVAKSVYVPSNIDTIPDSVLTLFPNVKVYYVDNPSSAVHLETDVQTAVQNKQITIYYKGEFNLADLFATSQKNLNNRLTALETTVGTLNTNLQNTLNGVV